MGFKDFGSVPERLEILREDLKLNKIQFSEVMEFSSSYYSRILSHEKPFSLLHAYYLAMQFKVNLNWLLMGDGSMYGEREELIDDDIAQYCGTNSHDIVERINYVWCLYHDNDIQTLKKGKFNPEKSDWPFFDEAYFPKDYFFKLLNGERAPTLKAILILTGYPVDLHWVLTGEGICELEHSFYMKHSSPVETETPEEEEKDTYNIEEVLNILRGATSPVMTSFLRRLLILNQVIEDEGNFKIIEREMIEPDDVLEELKKWVRRMKIVKPESRRSFL